MSAYDRTRTRCLKRFSHLHLLPKMSLARSLARYLTQRRALAAGRSAALGNRLSEVRRWQPELGEIPQQGDDQ